MSGWERNSKSRGDKISANTAFEVLNFYNSQILFSEKSNELAILGISFIEQILLSNCLVAVGAKPDNLAHGDTDENRVILSNARAVAESLLKAGIEFKRSAGTTKLSR